MSKSASKAKLHIEPYSILRDIIKNIWVVVLASLIGFMSVDMWNGSMYTPMYTSSATLIVNLKNSASYTYANLDASSEMAEIFTNVFVQPTMKAYAADNLGMDGFVGSVSSSVLSNTNIFTVSVTTPSPELSYKELTSILEIYPQISEAVFSDSVIEIMRQPNLPKSPSNHISDRNRSIAVFGCALVALVAIIWISLMRDTVKDEQTFHDEIDASLFGIIGHEKPHLTLKDMLKRKKSSRLITNAFSSFRFTEHYHKLATKLEYIQRNEGAKTFLITSLGENEGKSTIAANIALALASRNHKVALLDMDFKKPALHKVFGLRDEVTDDLGALLSGSKTLSDYRFHQYKQMSLDLALNKKSYANYADWLYSDRMGQFFDTLRASDYDFLIIDTPPLSVAADVAGLVQHSDRSLLAVRTDCVHTAAINDAVLSLSESGNFCGCILNDVHREFNLLGQLGSDESGAYGGYYNGYGYGRKHGYGYDRNGAYESYSKYSEYTNNDSDKE
ncbi:MAG: P-loop NTPase [Eubacteriales bacterium]